MGIKITSLMILIASQSNLIASGFKRPKAMPKGYLEAAHAKSEKEKYRAKVFDKQDPAQKDLFAKFMDSWRNHLANNHPNFDQYSPENQSKVKDNFANQYDQQLQIGQKNYDQRKLSEEIANLQNRLREIKRNDFEIRSQEDARLKPRSPLEEERSGPLET
ncbi:hypothetical protein A3J41_01630 [candidate division TM6 bacterium RIFCSPHIGHO2_12_FULL_38_8]|nr:MAG: hypothetical protein A3J41_01630 [candidate division TM6 bacterium RIFCSPHIGHO2_12_FULL_38_8]